MKPKPTDVVNEENTESINNWRNWIQTNMPELDALLYEYRQAVRDELKFNAETFAIEKKVVQYAAQEANKTQKQLLNELMDELPENKTRKKDLVNIQRDFLGDYTSRTKTLMAIQNINGFNEAKEQAESVIQNKLEGLS